MGVGMRDKADTFSAFGRTPAGESYIMSFRKRLDAFTTVNSFWGKMT